MVRVFSQYDSLTTIEISPFVGSENGVEEVVATMPVENNNATRPSRLSRFNLFSKNGVNAEAALTSDNVVSAVENQQTTRIAIAFV